MPVLDVKNLTIWFHTREGIVKAVDGIDFQVAEGEVLGIVGESGSGKSVACYSLLGLVPCPPGRIEQGEAYYQGKDLLKLGKSAINKLRGQEIAVIFQDPMTSLNPYLTIGEQLMEPLLYHKKMDRKQAKARAIEVLREVGIPEPENRFGSFPHEFSGGMRQRAMIAMALINEPRLLICDEPTTALDVTIQKQILQLIKNLQAKYNLSVIFISHDLGVVAGLADRVLVLQNGCQVETGRTRELFASPQQDYTRQLLDSIPQGHKSVGEEPKPEALITVENLRVWFQNHTNSGWKRSKEFVKAVDDISLTIHRHEIMGLVGESGSGKSTLGRAILALAPLTSGQILFDGQRVSNLDNKAMKPWRRRMQMIFQDPYASLNPRMTVFQALAEPLLYHRLANRKTITRQVVALMDDVGLARAYIRKYPHEFSGGQRQRIAIGRAIATKPDFIVADEPVSALDVTIQAQILDLILELVDRHNLTMLFISHDLSVVHYLADRTAVMRRGRLIEQGDTQKIWRDPQQPYTRELLSAVPGLSRAAAN